MANGGPSGASPQQVVGTPNLSPDRLGGERRALMQRHEDVMRRLRMLGPSFGGRPENEALRLSLINERRDLEDRIGTLGRAMGPGPVVNPADAEAGRARLMRTTGVDVRPEREKALAYAIALSNADPRGAGPNSPAGLEALDTNRPFEEADFAKRQAARDARTASARRELTTPLPGGEAPLSQYERLRRQEMLDTGRSAELATAQHGAALRTLEQVGKPNPMEAAQIREYAARAGVSEAQAQQIIDELRNPNSVQNRTRSAEKAVAGREAAAAASGTAPGATLATAGELLDKIDTRFFEKSPWLMRMFNRALGPYDVGGNVATGQTIQQDMADLDALDTMVVRRLERLAAAGDQLNAAQDAAAVLAKIPRPINGHTYTSKSDIAKPFAERLTSIRNRLLALIGQ